jgi:DNA-directed RNA polymerase subunit RPC12/RpoP
MVRGPLKYIIYLASAALIFFGLVFIISTNLGITYFFEGLVLLAVAGLLLILTQEKKPIEIKQTLTVTGPIKVREVRCPNCNAIVDPTKVQIVAGKPYVTCNYCGNRFELTEEPTW